MTNPIKKWWRRKLRESTEARKNDIRESFDIIERGGSIFLTYRGDAFEQIDTHARADEIAKKLENARLTALKFRGYGTDPADPETASV